MNTSAPTQHSWFALRVRPKMERIASLTLSGKNYEIFLPLYRLRRTWSDRSKVLDAPLFPGYLFCFLNPKERLMPVLTTPGVISIVSAGHEPLPIPAADLDAVKAIIQSGLPAQPWPLLTAGTTVFIEKGPLAGVEGIALDVDRRHRLIVSVPLLQRSIAVEIERHWVRPVTGVPCRRSIAHQTA